MVKPSLALYFVVEPKVILFNYSFQANINLCDVFCAIIYFSKLICDNFDCFIYGMFAYILVTSYVI